MQIEISRKFTEGAAELGEILLDALSGVGRFLGLTFAIFGMVAVMVGWILVAVCVPAWVGFQVGGLFGFVVALFGWALFGSATAAFLVMTDMVSS